MMPEPQMPVTPVAAVAAANPGSSDHRSQPITLKRGSSVATSMRTRSMAPGAARCPQLICAPSKAGPVGLEQASRRRLLPSTISALVPTSTSSVTSSLRSGPLGQHHTRGIGPHMAGNTRQHIDARIAMDMEIDLHRPQRDGAVGGQRKRRATELDRVDAQQQVVHDGIADEGGLQDVGGGDADLPRDIGGEFVDGATHGVGHLLLAARVHHQRTRPGSSGLPQTGSADS